MRDSIWGYIYITFSCSCTQSWFLILYNTDCATLNTADSDTLVSFGYTHNRSVAESCNTFFIFWGTPFLFSITLLMYMPTNSVQVFSFSTSSQYLPFIFLVRVTWTSWFQFSFLQWLMMLKKFSYICWPFCTYYFVKKKSVEVHCPFSSNLFSYWVFFFPNLSYSGYQPLSGWRFANTFSI